MAEHLECGEAQATFDADAHSVHAACVIAAPCDRVFRALTDPLELGSWWGREDAYRTTNWNVDPRPAGAWSCTTIAAGAPAMSVGGVYVVVEAPRRLEFTWRASWDDLRTVVSIELRPIDLEGHRGTRLTLEHSGLPYGSAMGDGTADGWGQVLAWLATHLAGAPATAARTGPEGA